MTQHVRQAHPPGDGCPSDRGCNICNLFLCAVCGGAEGSLASECPGFKMPADLETAICAGAIDYRNGR